MRKCVLTAITLFLLHTLAWANCLESGIYAFPMQQEISTNSIFMLEGYAESQSIIKNLNKKHPAYLVSSEEIIELEIIEQFEGMHRLSQVTLKPVKPLTSGQTYQLQIDSLQHKQLDDLVRWNEKTEELEPISWTAYSHVKPETPHWIKRPKLKENVHLNHISQPRFHQTVNFATKVSDKRETLVKTEWVDTLTGETKTYYLLSIDGEIQIGHGRCSGAFIHEEHHSYKVRFQLVNSIGETIDWTAWFNYDF